MIEFLYSLAGICGVVAYYPQLAKLFRATLPCHDISLSSWGMWVATSGITLLYSLYGQEIVDIRFASVSALYFTCNTLIVSTTLYKRHKYGKMPVSSIRKEYG